MHESYDLDLKDLAAAERASARLGVIGGGQLARMTAMAALPLGCEVIVLERNPFSPGANLAPLSLVGDWDDPRTLAEFASRVDVVTLENEFVDAAVLRRLEDAGRPVFPTSTSIALTQDKLVQKETLAGAGIPVPAFGAVTTPGDVLAFAREHGWPLLLKARRNGYDGKGNRTVRSAEEVPAAWESLGGGRNALFAEAFWPFAKELAVIVTRGRGGDLEVYPVVETVQRDHICHEVLAPARVPPEVARRAHEVARRAVTAVGAVGSFGVEMFLSADGVLAVNELAPRVHNSGHYTIEACLCSQFENHVRAVLGWPLGSARMVRPAAVMLNLLGARRAPGRPGGLEHALGVPGAHVHLYGKAVSGPGRKMGHVTALGDTVEEAAAAAARAAEAISFGDDA